MTVESDQDREFVSEENLSLERRNGRWRLTVPIMFSNWKDSHNFIKTFKEIEGEVPPSLVSHDRLSLSWDELKKQNLI
ncbi:MAG: hypothetical protein N2484_07615 [Clostridia bacterium]|nr:hypothetical protein [Clostridia bacterium]